LLTNGALERHDNLNNRARIRILDADFSTKFFDSLAHASNANAEAIRTKFSNLRLHHLAVVPDGDG
jgi:hypothetical protein